VVDISNFMLYKLNEIESTNKSYCVKAGYAERDANSAIYEA